MRKNSVSKPGPIGSNNITKYVQRDRVNSQSSTSSTTSLNQIKQDLDATITTNNTQLRNLQKYQLHSDSCKKHGTTMDTNRTHKTQRHTFQSIIPEQSPWELMIQPPPPLTRVNTDTKIYISTLNARSLNEESKLQELVSALQEMKWDIICLSEIRRNCESIIIRNSVAIFLHGPAENSQLGVGFYVKSNRNHS